MSKLSDKIGGFATIPNTVIKLIPRMGQDAFTLWSYLRFRTNGESGLAFPSYATIHADTGLHYRKIAASIRKLEELDILERHKRFGASTEYTLKTPDPNAAPTSPATIGSTVLPPLAEQSCQRMQTNKTDSIKIDSNKNSTPENGAVRAEPQLEPASVDRAKADADFSKKFQEIQAKQDQARIDATAQRMLELAEQKAAEQAAAPEHLKAVELGKGGAEERRERYRLAAAIAEACGTPLVPKHPAYYVAANLFKAPPVKPDGEKATVDEMISFSKSITKKLDDANWMPSRMRTYFARIVAPPARPAPEPERVTASAPAVTQDEPQNFKPFDINEYRARRERSLKRRYG